LKTKHLPLFNQRGQFSRSPESTFERLELRAIFFPNDCAAHRRLSVTIQSDRKVDGFAGQKDQSENSRAGLGGEGQDPGSARQMAFGTPLDRPLAKKTRLIVSKRAGP
jgi:hypothetical protein